MTTCGVFRLMNSNSDQTKGIVPFSESALWVIITRHQHTHHQLTNQSSTVKTTTNQSQVSSLAGLLLLSNCLSPFFLLLLLQFHLSFSASLRCPSCTAGATRANIDRCYVMSRLLAFLPYQRCLSSDNGSKNTHRENISTDTRILIIDVTLMQYKSYGKPVSAARRLSTLDRV